MPEVVQIGGARIVVSPGRVKTYLPSGAVVVAEPQADPTYRERALSLGFRDRDGETAEAAMNRTHDITHVFVAWCFGENACPVLDAVSRGAEWDGAAAREELVLRVQALIAGAGR